MRDRRLAVWAVLPLAVLGAIFLPRSCGRRPSHAAPPAAAVKIPQKIAKPPLAKPAKTSAKAQLPAPPAVILHKELIPKDIEIVRCYYEQVIVPPQASFGFDIDGSGFTAEFEKMIRVDAATPGVRVKNLRLVTADQIHGEMEVGPDAATALVYPKVLIKDLPVFTAADPFGVVRPGEVLLIRFLSLFEDGRGGVFQIITNLDEGLFKQFSIQPSTPGLRLSDIAPRLPFAVEGTLRVGPEVPTGGYDLSVLIGSRQVYRKDGLIQVVRPNVGADGLVLGLTAEEPHRRPGDAVKLFLDGSGFDAKDLSALKAHVDGFDMGPGTFAYVSPVRMAISFHCPANAPLGSYGATILSNDGKTLVAKKDVFSVVGPDWVEGVELATPLRPGQKAVVRILGRDFSPDFARALRVSVDEPGLLISRPRRLDADTLAADIAADASIAPGDYWLRLSARGRAIVLPHSGIIKVEKPL